MTDPQPDPALLRYVEQNIALAEAQCLRLATLIKRRRAKGRETKSYERLLSDLQAAVQQVLGRMPFSAGD